MWLLWLSATSKSSNIFQANVEDVNLTSEVYCFNKLSMLFYRRNQVQISYIEYDIYDNMQYCHWQNMYIYMQFTNVLYIGNFDLNPKRRMKSLHHSALMFEIPEVTVHISVCISVKPVVTRAIHILPNIHAIIVKVEDNEL